MTSFGNFHQNQTDERLREHDEWVVGLKKESEMAEQALRPARLEYLRACARDVILRMILLPGAESSRDDIAKRKISKTAARRIAEGKVVPVPQGLGSVLELDGHYLDIDGYRFFFKAYPNDGGQLRIDEVYSTRFFTPRPKFFVR